MLNSIFAIPSETKYDTLQQQEPTTDIHHVDVIHNDSLYHFSRKAVLIPWTLVLIFASLSALLYVTDKQPIERSYETGWSTDFGPARSAIRIKPMRFNGSPSFYGNGSIFIPHPDPVKYVGIPNPNIDAAWDSLTATRYFRISENEARTTWGSGYQKHWHHKKEAYIAGLDMFHTLHCLNQLRKELAPEYYPPKHPGNALVHSGHCIEQIRQYIMCAGDITPLPTTFYPALDRNYVESDVVHTCRDFDSLRTWLSSKADAQNEHENEQV